MRIIFRCSRIARGNTSSLRAKARRAGSGAGRGWMRGGDKQKMKGSHIGALIRWTERGKAKELKMLNVRPKIEIRLFHLQLYTCSRLPDCQSPTHLGSHRQREQ